MPLPTLTNVVDAGAEPAAGDDGRHRLLGVVEDGPAGDSRGGLGSGKTCGCYPASSPIHPLPAHLLAPALMAQGGSGMFTTSSLATTASSSVSGAVMVNMCSRSEISQSSSMSTSTHEPEAPGQGGEHRENYDGGEYMGN